MKLGLDWEGVDLSEVISWLGAAIVADPHWSAPFPPLLTVQQAADLLQIPKSTIYDWSSRGRLTHCVQRVGKHLRIHSDRLLKTAAEGGLTNHV